MSNERATILFLQGAGTGAYDADALLADSLRDALGDGYVVRYPRMPREDEPEYAPWVAQIEAELAAIDGDVVLVGHSFGGSVLLRWLCEVGDVAGIVGVFVAAAPYWGAGGWSWDEIALPADAAAKLARVPLYLYHGREDEEVPFDHLALYAAALPHAIVREVAGGGHQLGNDLTIVARDVRELVDRRR